jgi:uncharacterized membrane protein
MSIETDLWLHVAHIVGFTLWVAGLLASASLLRAHEGADAASRPGMISAARSMAAIMEVGATLAIAAGLTIAFASPRYPNTAFKTGGWLHVKLLLVVLAILVPHGLVRAKIAKLRRGTTTKPLPGWVIPAILAGAVAIIALGAHPLLLRK